MREGGRGSGHGSSSTPGYRNQASPRITPGDGRSLCGCSGRKWRRRRHRWRQAAAQRVRAHLCYHRCAAHALRASGFSRAVSGLGKFSLPFGGGGALQSVEKLCRNKRVAARDRGRSGQGPIALPTGGGVPRSAARWHKAGPPPNQGLCTVSPGNFPCYVCGAAQMSRSLLTGSSTCTLLLRNGTLHQLQLRHHAPPARHRAGSCSLEASLVLPEE